MIAQKIDGSRLGRLSLGLDAVYCAMLGVILVCAAGWVTQAVALPATLVVIAELTVVVWAAGIVWMLARLQLRLVLRVVMLVNIFAAVIVGLVASTATTLFAVLAVLAIAVDVALFAVSQLFALRHGASRL